MNSIPIKLSYFRSLPATDSSRTLLLDYITKTRIPITPTQRLVSPSADLYQLIFDYYRSKLGLIIRQIQAFRIRKQYLELLSSETDLNFYLDMQKGQLIKVPTTRRLYRKLANQYNFIDGTQIADLDPYCRFICREQGSLYAFDLRELAKFQKDMKEFVNPYTNIKFSHMTLMLLGVRQSKVPLELRQLDQDRVIELRQKITNLIAQLELNGAGSDLEVAKVVSLSSQQWVNLTLSISRHNLVDSIVTAEPNINRLIGQLPTMMKESWIYTKQACVIILNAIISYPDDSKSMRNRILKQRLAEQCQLGEPSLLYPLHMLSLNEQLVQLGVITEPDPMLFSSDSEDSITNFDANEADIQQRPQAQPRPQPYNLRPSKRPLPETIEKNQQSKRSRRK